MKNIFIALIALVLIGCRGGGSTSLPDSNYTENGDRFQLAMSTEESKVFLKTLKTGIKTHNEDEVKDYYLTSGKEQFVMHLTKEQAIDVIQQLEGTLGEPITPSVKKSRRDKSGDASFGPGGLGISTGNGFQYNLQDGHIGPSWGN